MRLFGPGQREDASTRRMVRLGAPIGLQALVEAARWLAFFLVIERLGEGALAISSLVFACYVVLLIPSQAFAEAAYTMISGSLGRGAGERLAPLVRSAAWRAIAVTLPLLALAAIVPETVLALFTDDVLPGAGATLTVVALGMLLVVASEIGLAAVFGTGDTDAGFVIELIISGTFVGCAAITALVLELPLPYVWLSLPLAAAVGFVVSVAWLRSGRWRRVVL